MISLKKKVIIFGTSVFAEVVHFYLTHDSPHKVVAFTANKKFINNKKFLGLPIIPFEEIKNKYPPEKYSLFIAIGYQGINKVRAKIFAEAKKKGYELLTYVNSKVTKWEKLHIGENCFIFENVVIQPFVKIGDDVIIWSGNHIGHHTKIGNHCFITSHVVISGSVVVGPYCFLGVNSTIRDGIKIGRECIIGAGSVVLHDTKEKEVYSPKNTKTLPISSDKIKRI